LTSVGVVGIAGAGGDLDALRDRGRTWNSLIEQDVSIFQTDEPEALIEFLARRDAKTPRPIP
jgi:glycerophosphoryl diester phosphodiesterase